MRRHDSGPGHARSSQQQSETMTNMTPSARDGRLLPIPEVVMSVRNLVWLFVALAFVAGGCSEDRSKQDRDHPAHGDGECCAFHAKKEVAEPKRVELGKATAAGIEVTAARVGDLKANELILIQ